MYVFYYSFREDYVTLSIHPDTPRLCGNMEGFLHQEVTTSTNEIEIALITKNNPKGKGFKVEYSRGK